MISVCIATHNNKPYLMECLYALVKTQTYCDTNEIIIYDNDSTDGTDLAVELFQRNNPKCNIVYEKGPNLYQYGALHKCYQKCKNDITWRIHTDHIIVKKGWEAAFIKAAKKALHPYLWVLCSRSIEPIHSYYAYIYHIIKDYGQNIEQYHKYKGNLFKDFVDHNDDTIIQGYREPYCFSKKLYDKLDHEAMLSLKGYAGDDFLIMNAYHLGVRRFYMVNNVLTYHIAGARGGQTNARAGNADKDNDDPYIFFETYWKSKGYKDARHPGAWLSQLIPQCIPI